MDHGTAVCMALNEMNPGHGRHALEIRLTIHGLVDRPLSFSMDGPPVQQLVSGTACGQIHWNLCLPPVIPNFQFELCLGPNVFANTTL
jgi:hypothetical protein